MAFQQDNKRITAIVPTYNEAARIEAVLAVLSTYKNFLEIIVVDDGSTDLTKEIVKKYPIRYVKNDINRGKGFSMDRAVKMAQGDVLFFCDADVSGLTHSIIDAIVEPVLEGKVDMFIGMRNRKIYFTNKVFALIPLLGGERAMVKSLWYRVPDYYKHYFRIETGLNFYAKHEGKGFDFAVFKGLKQVIKEKKYGLLKGTYQRIQLYSDLITASIRLELVRMYKLLFVSETNV
jgi:glycosyltransferase involved in cell wall biosynthesis